MAKEPKKLEDLFHDTLKDIYFAEKKILSSLPKMAKAAQSDELRAAFEKHHALPGCSVNLSSSSRAPRTRPGTGSSRFLQSSGRGRFRS